MVNKLRKNESFLQAPRAYSFGKFEQIAQSIAKKGGHPQWNRSIEKSAALERLRRENWLMYKRKTGSSWDQVKKMIEEGVYREDALFDELDEITELVVSKIFSIDRANILEFMHDLHPSTGDMERRCIEIHNKGLSISPNALEQNEEDEHIQEYAAQHAVKFCKFPDRLYPIEAPNDIHSGTRWSASQRAAFI